MKNDIADGDIFVNWLLTSPRVLLRLGMWVGMWVGMFVHLGSGHSSGADRQTCIHMYT